MNESNSQSIQSIDQSLNEANPFPICDYFIPIQTERMKTAMMPKLFFLKSKSKSTTSPLGPEKHSGKNRSNRKSRGIFRRKPSSADELELQAGITWTSSEDSCTAEGIFDDKQTLKLSNDAGHLFFKQQHQTEINSLNQRHGQEIATKDSEIKSLKDQQKEMDHKQAKEIHAFEKVLVNQESELLEAKEQLSETKDQLFEVSATLIQTQLQLHDLSASWQFSFWSQN
jgi:hypothetical protein